MALLAATGGEKGDVKMEEARILEKDLVAACQRAVMLCRAFGVPEGEIDHLQAAIDRYYETRMAGRGITKEAGERRHGNG